MTQGCLLCGHCHFFIGRIVAVAATMVVLGQVELNFLEGTNLAYCAILEDDYFVGVGQQAVVVCGEDDCSTGFSEVTI